MTMCCLVTRDVRISKTHSTIILLCQVQSRIFIVIFKRKRQVETLKKMPPIIIRIVLELFFIDIALFPV